MTQRTLDVALAYLRSGLSVLPADGPQKRPAVASWKTYQQRRPTEDEVRDWFERDRPICLVAGAVSGGLEMIDFDGGGEKFAWWKQLVELQAPGLIDKLVLERTPSGGWHVAYRHECEVLGNLKLAERAVVVPNDQEVTLYGKKYRPRLVGDRWEVLLTLIETRGEGGIFLCDPTPGYEVVQGNLASPPVLTEEERFALLDVAWSLSELRRQVKPEPRLAPEREPAATREANGRPGDDFNERGDVRAVLRKHGWQLARGGENEHWRRPGKAAGTSATLKEGVFYVFSSSATPFEPNRAYAPFSVYALLEHAGDFSAAAAALRGEGFGGEDGDGPLIGCDLSPPTLGGDPPAEAAIVDIVAEATDNEPIDEAIDPGEFPEACLRPPGLLTEIIDYNLSTSIYPQPVLALAGAIGLLGAITGRKIRDCRDCRTNVYLLVLAASGIGKDRAREVNKELLVAANCLSLIGPDRLTSHVGIMSELESWPVKLFQPDEFHATLQSIAYGRNSPHLKHIPEVLKEAYSSAGSLWKPTCYGDRKQNLTINQPHAVLHATAVPGAFWESVTTELVLSGFIGRTILFLVPKLYPPPTDHRKVPPPERLVSGIAWWRDFVPGGGDLQAVHPTPFTVEESCEAHDRLFAHMQEIRVRQAVEDEVRSALWGRSAQKTAQLALLFAASRQTGRTAMRIEIQDVELAILLNNWSTRQLVHHALTSVADSAHQRLVQKMLAAIPREWITKNTLTRKTHHIADRLVRERIMNDLIESEQVAIDSLRTATKPTTVYRRKCRLK